MATPFNTPKRYATRTPRRNPTQSRFGYSSTNPKYQLARVTTGDFAAAGQIGTTRSAVSIVERRWATMIREIGSARIAVFMTRSFSSSR
jgi:hypothetical protein